MRVLQIIREAALRKRRLLQPFTMTELLKPSTGTNGVLLRELQLEVRESFLPVPDSDSVT